MTLECPNCGGCSSVDPARTKEWVAGVDPDGPLPTMPFYIGHLLIVDCAHCGILFVPDWIKVFEGVPEKMVNHIKGMASTDEERAG